MSFTWQDAVSILGGDTEKWTGRERFVSEVASANSLTAKQAAEMFPGVSFSESGSIVYFPVRMCHSLPMINKRRRCFTARTLANSHRTAKDALVNIDHELIDNGNSSRDNICGHVVATSFDNTFQWKPGEVADIPLMPTQPVPMYALGALYTRHKSVPGIIGSHLNGKNKWDVSMECGHNWKDAHILVQDEFIPFTEAPGALLEGITPTGAKGYRGKDVAVALGGVSGRVDFWGLAMTECPADPGANILSFFAGIQAEAASVGKSTYFLPIRTSLVGSAASMKLVDKMTDTFFKEIASIEVIGKTEPAEDGHVHEVLSNGTILPFEGHAHYLDSYSLRRGTTPRFTAQTSMHYRRTESGSNEVVHLHLIDIPLRGKSQADLESASSSDLPIDSSIEGVDSVNIHEVLRKLDSITAAISSGNPSKEMEKELADIKAQLGSAKIEKEIADQVDAKVAEMINAGKLVTKEASEKATADAVKEVKDAQEKKAKNEAIITGRLDEVSGFGLDINAVMSGDEEADKVTFGDFVRSVGPEDEAGWKRNRAFIKTLAEAIVKPASSAANTGGKQPVIGSPAGKVGKEAASTGDKQKVGKNAISGW